MLDCPSCDTPVELAYEVIEIEQISGLWINAKVYLCESCDADLLEVEI